MGNRAVITSKAKKMGIYVHWNGGPESVIGFMDACKKLNFRNPNEDPSYGFARVCQAIGTYFGGSTSLGVGTLRSLDCNNWDNGVYVIDENWNICGRYGKGSPSKGTPLPTFDSLSEEDRKKASEISDTIVKALESSKDS